MKPNLLERSIAIVSPEYALRRERSRLALDATRKMSSRGYDGAKKGRRLANWGGVIRSPNSDISNDRDTLIARSRDLEQNDPFAKGSFDAIVTNVVGDGIIPTPYIFQEDSDTLPANKKKVEKFDQLLEDWADTSRCDFNDQTSLYGLQGLAMRTIAQSGMCFVVKKTDPENKSLPLRIQVLEPDQLDLQLNKITSTSVIFRGIEISKSTKRIAAYWLLPDHPDATFDEGATKKESVRFAVEDVLAPFMLLRPGQLIGVPWLYAGMVRLHDFSKYEGAQLVKQEVSALTVTYVTRDAPPDEDLGGDGEEENYYETREPGGHIYLNPGETAVPANPPSVDGYSEFSQNTLRGVARAMGLTYEELTTDYSNVNFSSARMGWMSMNRNIKMWRSHMFHPMFLDKLGGWLIQAGQIKLGDLSFMRIKWTPPRREMIDPVKEISANAVALETLQTSLTEIYAESGRDFKKTLREIIEERKLLEEAGIAIKGVTDLVINIGDDKEEKDKNAKQP